MAASSPVAAVPLPASALSDGLVRQTWDLIWPDMQPVPANGSNPWPATVSNWR
ncbi:hypothetical protein X762_21210 [Mesorhizobium sp. LSHC426A00]|nr:hypothetical protein X762_21210 [Mesorhizobium sp. LSHC426A00]